MESIYDILEEIAQLKQQAVLATIIHVEGSAYRKQGTSMLFLEDGRQIGMLSGSCLEHDLAEHAAEIMRQGIARTILYDLRPEDDLSWGQGCNGLLHILLEPMDCRQRKDLGLLKYYLEQGESVTNVRIFSPVYSVVGSYYETASGAIFGQYGDCRAGDGQLRYVHPYKPKPRLIIFGAGPDVRPLVSFAAQADFSVWLSDWRPALCSTEHFPLAHSFVVGQPGEVLTELKLMRRDCVLLMTHHFPRDQELLQLLMDEELLYLGVLGPRRRTARLLNGAEIPQRIHSPAGLSIGAQGPYEIAISILAELIDVYRNSDVRSGKERVYC